MKEWQQLIFPHCLGDISNIKRSSSVKYVCKCGKVLETKASALINRIRRKSPLFCLSCIRSVAKRNDPDYSKYKDFLIAIPKSPQDVITAICNNGCHYQVRMDLFLQRFRRKGKKSLCSECSKASLSSGWKKKLEGKIEEIPSKQDSEVEFFCNNCGDYSKITVLSALRRIRDKTNCNQCSTNREHLSEETRDRLSKVGKKAWEDHRDKIIKNLKKVWTPDRREKQSKITKELWDRADYQPGVKWSLEKIKTTLGDRFEFLHNKEGSSYTIKCNACKEIKKRQLPDLHKNCSCQPGSYDEDQLRKFIESLGCKTKKIKIERKEIDIYIPLLNLGIEYNGLYWHSELFRNKYSHYDKTKVCSENSIHLIQI